MRGQGEHDGTKGDMSGLGGTEQTGLRVFHD